MSIISWGQIQSYELPEPTTEDTGPPPPLGLPIDFGAPGLIAVGIALGIYFLRTKKIS